MVSGGLVEVVRANHAYFDSWSGPGPAQPVVARGARSEAHCCWSRLHEGDGPGTSGRTGAVSGHATRSKVGSIPPDVWRDQSLPVALVASPTRSWREVNHGEAKRGVNEMMIVRPALGET